MSKDQDKHVNGHSVQNGESYVANEVQNGQLYPSLENHTVMNHNTMQHYADSSSLPPSYEEIDQSGAHRGSRFGLIRGYHQQMYEPIPQPLQCCDCSGMQQKRGQNDSKCNWGVICGVLLLILGVLALVMGFTLPQKTPTLEERRRLSEQDLKDLQKLEFYVEVFIITGLSVLSLGGIVISAGILYPLFRKERESQDEPYLNKYYSASEVYVKREEFTPSSKQIVNFGFHKDVVPTDITLRKIQPERDTRQPVDSPATLK